MPGRRVVCLFTSQLPVLHVKLQRQQICIMQRLSCLQTNSWQWVCKSDTYPYITMPSTGFDVDWLYHTALWTLRGTEVIRLMRILHATMRAVSMKRTFTRMVQWEKYQCNKINLPLPTPGRKINHVYSYICRSHHAAFSHVYMTQVSSDSRGLPGATARDDDNAAQQSRTQNLTKQKK